MRSAFGGRFVAKLATLLLGICLSSAGMSAPLATSFTLPVSIVPEPYAQTVGEWFPFPYYGRHLGQDIRVEAGTPVYAIADGVVKFSKYVTTLGDAIHIEHTLPDQTKIVSVYYHITKKDLPSKVALGEIKKGALIGHTTSKSGDYGEGFHLHFGIRKGAYTYVSPDPRTNVWFYPGYTSKYLIHKGIKSQVRDATSTHHNEILAEWEQDPIAYIRNKINTASLLPFLDDQFDGATLNTTLWVAAGNSVAVLNGAVDLRADQTDNTGRITTTFPEKQHIRIEMRHLMHAANDFFFPRIHLNATNPEGFVGVRWLRSAYSPDYCYDGANFNKVQIFSGTGGNCTAFYSSLISSDYYDRWITSIINYDSVTGLFTLDNDGDGTIDFSTTVAIANRYPITSAYIDGYGWWTGHSHQIDYIKIYDLSK